jgi:hypothetical protein
MIKYAFRYISRETPYSPDVWTKFDNGWMTWYDPKVGGFYSHWSKLKTTYSDINKAYQECQRANNYGLLYGYYAIDICD